MPAFYCSICSDPVVEGSSLCARHQAAAARFSTAFGSTTETNTTVSPEPAPPNELDAHLKQGIEDILSWASQQPPDVTRWPQLAFYFLRGGLKRRRFYGVIPAGANADTSFTLSREVLEPALAGDGEIGQSLQTLLKERSERLALGQIQMLFIDIKPHDNMISVGTTLPDKTREVLKNFVFHEGAFVSA